MGEPAVTQEASALKRTPLYALHVELGGKMVPFAGYEMPVQYPAGVLTEHKHTRAAAGLFDVSHMGQAWLAGDAAASLFERLVPGDVTGLKPGRMRYSLLLNDEGGIRDDLMITRAPDPAGADGLFLVVNAACKDADFAHIKAELGGDLPIDILDDRALLALQGPKAAAVLARHMPDCANMPFMTGRKLSYDGETVYVNRCGYTGEDGFEISLPAYRAEAFARTLLGEEEVLPIGLGARDSLRLEAGLCLYGHDIDETTSPIEANLAWAIQKRRREAGDFPGATRILRELADGPSRLRVGIRPDGRAPAREGTEVFKDGQHIGTITSGGFGPTAEGPVAMGYVERGASATGTRVDLMVRGKAHGAEIVDMPFVPHRYYRGK